MELQAREQHLAAAESELQQAMEAVAYVNIDLCCINMFSGLSEQTEMVEELEKQQQLVCRI